MESRHHLPIDVYLLQKTSLPLLSSLLLDRLTPFTLPALRGSLPSLESTHILWMEYTLLCTHLPSHSGEVPWPSQFPQRVFCSRKFPWNRKFPAIPISSHLAPNRIFSSRRCEKCSKLALVVPPQTLQLRLLSALLQLASVSEKSLSKSYRLFESFWIKILICRLFDSSDCRFDISMLPGINYSIHFIQGFFWCLEREGESCDGESL